MYEGAANVQTRQAIVYVAGPIVGALLAGAFLKAVYEPALADGPWDESSTRPAPK